MPMLARTAPPLPRISKGKWERQMATRATCRYNFYKVLHVTTSGIFENTAMPMYCELIRAPKALQKLSARARGGAHA